MSLEFKAADYLSPGTPNVEIGVGDIVEGRTAVCYLPDNNNIWQSFATTVPGRAYLDSQWWLYGAPAATNLFTYSRDLSNLAWTQVQGAENDVIANGDFDSDTEWTKGTGWTIAAGVASCDGTQTGSSYLKNSTANTEGIRYKFTFTVSNYSAGNVNARIGGDNGTARSGNGTFIDYLESAAGDEIWLRADADFIGDIDNVIVQKAVSHLNAVGLTGVADSATTLTDDDTSANEQVNEYLDCPDDSLTNTWRFFIKKDNDETRFMEMQCQLATGTLKQLALDLNTKTGATAVRTSTGTVASEVNSAGDWWEVLISVLNDSSGNVSARTFIYPALGTILGTVDSSVTGSCIIANAEFHLDKTIKEVRRTSPIFCDAGSTVTIDAPALTIDDDNHNQTEGLWYLEAKDISMTGNHGLIGRLSGRIAYSGNTTIVAWDGATSVTVTPSQSNDGTVYPIATVYGSDLMKLFSAALVSSEETYDGTWGADGDINLLNANQLSGTPPVVPLFIRNMRFYSGTYAEGLILAPDLMLGIFPGGLKNLIAVTRRTASQMRPKQRMNKPKMNLRELK